MGVYTNLFIICILLIAICSDFTQGAPPSKIVGGNYVSTITNWPSIVSLQYNNGHYCGGTLISRCHVLTAAHCVEGVNAMSMRVNTGNTDQMQMQNSYAIARFDVHPGYRGRMTMYHHDLAIITLRQCITENAYQKVAKMYPGYLANGVQGTVAGWGLLSYDGQKTSQFLRYIQTTVISNAQCLNSYSATTIRSEQMCTMPGVGHGVCGGDSGGPLVVQNQLAGVVSMVADCGKGWPDIFSRVSSYSTWISSIIGS